MRSKYIVPYVICFLLSSFILFFLIIILFPSFSALQWLVLSLVPSIFISHFWAISRERKAVNDHHQYGKDEFNPNLYGFGGWLYLLALQMIVSFIQQIANLGTLIEMINDGTYNDLYSQTSIYGYYFWLSLGFSLLMVVLIVLTGATAFKQKKSFIRFALSYQVTVLLFSLMTYYFEVRLDIVSNVVLFIISWIAFILWGSYLKKSKRVNQTFIK